MWHLSSGNTDLPYICSVQFISVTQSCLTLCNLMACSMPGLPVHHQLQVYSSHVNWVGNAILCRPLLLPPSIFPSIRVFSNESVICIRWPKYWSFSFNINPSSEYSGLISFRMDWLDLLAVQRTLKTLLQHHSSKASILWCLAFWSVYRFLKRQVRWSGIPISFRIFHSLLWSTQSLCVSQYFE